MAFLVVFLCGLALPAHATPVVDATVWAELGRVQSLAARFAQVQHRAILKVPLVSEGHVAFTRGGSLSWVVERPVASTFTLAGTRATMDMPDVGAHEEFDLGAMPDAQRLATSLLVWMQADAVAVARDFDATYRQSPPGVELKPRDSRLAGLVELVVIDLSAAPWRVTGVKFTEPDGDRVDIAFTRVVLDGTAIPDPTP